MLEIAVTTVFSLAAGGIGWLLFHLVGKHLIKFYELRSDIHEALVYHANVRDDTLEPYRSDARDELRRLAACLAALDIALTKPNRAFMTKRQYDLERAVGDLIGLSNSFHKDGGGDWRAFRQGVSKALKLPLR